MQRQIKEPALKKRLVTAAFLGSMGGFVFGYDLGALSAATQSLRAHFGLSPAVFGFTISTSLWGTVCGSLLAGRLADRVGRRNLIAGCPLLYALAAIGITLSIPSGWTLVLAMRFLCGMAIGGFTVGCPLYLSELAPITLHGRLVGLFQVQIGVGVVTASSFGVLFSRLLATADVWKWCRGVGAIPATFLFLMLRYTSQEAPQLTISGDQSEACTIESSSLRHGPLARERLFRRKNMRPILLATSIAIFNQLSGVNVLLYICWISCPAPV